MVSGKVRFSSIGIGTSCHPLAVMGSFHTSHYSYIDSLQWLFTKSLLTVFLVQM